MIREILAIALIVSGLFFWGWFIAAPDRMLTGAPMAAGELTIGLWFFFLQPEGGKWG